MGLVEGAVEWLLMQRKQRAAIVFLAVWCCLRGVSGAVDFPPKPPPEDFFVDEADRHGPEDGEAINKMAKSLLADEQIPIIVVTVSSLLHYGAADGTIESYAKNLFDHYGIGRKSRNYGMLLLVSKGDRKARIELGAGFGHDHDTDAEQVMNKLILPQFRKGMYSNGILDGVRGMDAMARGLSLPRSTLSPLQIIVPILLVGLIIFVAVSLIRSGRKGWGWALLAFLAIAIFFLLRNAGKAGSGAAFGGGSSGGGGATGSW